MSPHLVGESPELATTATSRRDLAELVTADQTPRPSSCSSRRDEAVAADRVAIRARTKPHAPPEVPPCSAREEHAPPRDAGDEARDDHAPPPTAAVRQSRRVRPPSVRRREAAAAAGAPPCRRRRRSSAVSPPPPPPPVTAGKLPPP
ncbi:hypothetical protein N665_0721s0013 [Sinapis alba]|nr:hypothetical protein N665_0721s0013 [Sinapis alba]